LRHSYDGTATVDTARSVHAKRGRPRQIGESERRQLLLDAAEQAFVEQGYTAASMDDIARRAGMSKKTLYRIFDTKEALFAAVIASRRAALDAIIGADELSVRRDPREALHSFMTKLAGFVLAPRQSALYRLAIAESQRAPELARAFHHEGPSKACHMLQDWLREQGARGALSVPDPSVAANMLFSMVVADAQTCMLIGDAQPPDEAAIAQRVDKALHLFLGGALPRNASVTALARKSGR
jgi:AcrR family transcriptional regulator